VDHQPHPIRAAHPNPTPEGTPPTGPLPGQGRGPGEINGRPTDTSQVITLVQDSIFTIRVDHRHAAIHGNSGTTSPRLAIPMPKHSAPIWRGGRRGPGRAIRVSPTVSHTLVQQGDAMGAPGARSSGGCCRVEPMPDPIRQLDKQPDPLGRYSAGSTGNKYSSVPHPPGSVTNQHRGISFLRVHASQVSAARRHANRHQGILSHRVVCPIQWVHPSLRD
jgi:hypothetical protein